MLEKNRVNNGFKITFVINWILLLIAVLLRLCSRYVFDFEKMGIFLRALFAEMLWSYFGEISFYLLGITTILGIVNYLKNPKREIRRKIIIMLSSIIIIHSVIFGLAYLKLLTI